MIYFAVPTDVVIHTVQIDFLPCIFHHCGCALAASCQWSPLNWKLKLNIGESNTKQNFNWILIMLAAHWLCISATVQHINNVFTSQLCPNLQLMQGQSSNAWDDHILMIKLDNVQEGEALVWASIPVCLNASICTFVMVPMMIDF